jgi:Thaumarchaeal output domain 1
MLIEINDKKITRFQPSFEHLKGYNYNDLKYYDIDGQMQFLKTAHKFGISFKEHSISIFKCTNCRYNGFDISFICKVCSSTKIVKGIAIEHDECGGLDFEHRYNKFRNELLCHKCDTPLNAVGVDYSVKGTYYECLDCKSFLPNVDYNYKCFRCSKEHTQDNLEINELFSYTIDLFKVKALIESNNSILSVSKELSRSAINSNILDTIIGNSGLNYTFPLIIYNNQNYPSILVNILNIEDETDSGETFVLSFIARCSDIKISQKILICTPYLKEELKTLCFNNGIKVIEAISQDKAEVDLVKVVTNICNVRTNEVK